MDVLLELLGLVVALLAGTWWVRRRADLWIVRRSLADAPEPYWSEIRATLAETRLVSPAALREGGRRWPAVAGGEAVSNGGGGTPATRDCEAYGPEGRAPEGRSDDPAGLAPQAAGEVKTGKRCAFCGVAGTVLAWRPSERASSPLAEAKWWPTRSVYEAKLTCPRCGCASYGWLIAAEPRDLTGEFLIATPAELSPW